MSSQINLEGSNNKPNEIFKSETKYPDGTQVKKSKLWASDQSGIIDNSAPIDCYYDAQPVIVNGETKATCQFGFTSNSRTMWSYQSVGEKIYNKTLGAALYEFDRVIMGAHQWDHGM